MCVPLLSCKNNMLRKRRNRASASLDSNREEHARTLLLVPSIAMIVLVLPVIVTVKTKTMLDSIYIYVYIGCHTFGIIMLVSQEGTRERTNKDYHDAHTANITS